MALLLNVEVQGMPEYRAWRQAVLDRDNYACQWCGVSDPLHVHHVHELSRIIDEYDLHTREEAWSCSILWDTNNGLCLCAPCHHTIPRPPEVPLKRRFKRLEPARQKHNGEN